MATFPAGLVFQNQLQSEVQGVLGKLGPEVVQAGVELKDDFTGDPSLYFHVVLTDEAAAKSLGEVGLRISSKVRAELQPMEKWGLFAYFRFFSETEMRSRGKLEPVA
jgi:hypothetical protein